MPYHHFALPHSATNLKVTRNGEDYPLLLDTDTFDRVGEGAVSIPVLPICGGDEYFGESLEGQWHRGWDALISIFTATISGGILRMTGIAAGAGVAGKGWINNHHPTPLVDDLEYTVNLQVPIDKTGAIPSRDIRFAHFIKQDKNELIPDNDDNFIQIEIDVDEVGLMMYLRKVVNGAAPVVFFDGSDYTGAVRTTGDLEGTIWRIVFNGKPGTDGATMSVFIKQAATIVLAEDEAWNELNLSPYDISDLAFNIGHASYRIYTQNVSYFGTPFTSANKASSSYLRLDYPSQFNVDYDWTEAEYGEGSVEVYDGVPSVTTRVFDEDHVFSGDIYIQNSLTRIHVDNAQPYGVNILSYYGGAWVEPVDQFLPHLVLSVEDVDHPFLTNIVYLSPEEVIIDVKMCDTNTNDDDYYIILRLTLLRGDLKVKCEIIEAYPLQDVRIWFYDSTTIRFGYAGDNEIGDDDVVADGVNVTMTDNFLVSFDEDGEECLGSMNVNEKPNTSFDAEDGGDLKFIEVDHTDLETAIFYLCLTPFSDITNLFYESETGGYSGDTQNDPNASPMGATQNTVRLDLTGDYQTPAGEYATYPFTAGDDLPAGHYLAAIRARYVDEVTMRMYVWNDDDDEYRNKENAKVIKTLAAALGYHSVFFEITDTDVSGTDDFVVVAENTTAGTDEILIDYVLIVPIGDGMNWPQDLGHSGIRGVAQHPRLCER